MCKYYFSRQPTWRFFSYHLKEGTIWLLVVGSQVSAGKNEASARAAIGTATPSRWAAMGRMDAAGAAADVAAPDLDEVLRRRRNAG